MKKFFLIILIFSLFSCGTRRLQGIYCHSFNGGFDSTCLTFNKKGNFIYKTSGDLGTYVTGKGKYELKNNVLKLSFEKDSVVKKSEGIIEDWSFRDDEETDSIDLIFKVYEAFNKELPATIFEESKDFSYSPENNVNANGALTITKPKNRKTEKYKIGFIGYELLEVVLDHNSTKEIKVILYPAQPQVISDTIHSYILKDIEKGSFLTSKDDVYKKVK